MSQISVLVTIRSNKLQAKKDSLEYNIELNAENFYTNSFRGTIIQEFEKFDRVLVKRDSDGTYINCARELFSEQKIIEVGGGGSGADEKLTIIIYNSDEKISRVATATSAQVLELINRQFVFDFEPRSNAGVMSNGFIPLELTTNTINDKSYIINLYYNSFTYKFFIDDESLDAYCTSTILFQDNRVVQNPNSIAQPADLYNVIFSEDATYGTPSTPVSGDIMLNEENFIKGISVLLIHSDTIEPNFSDDFNKISGSYVTNELNFIACESIDTNYIIYSISQIQI